MQPHNRPVDIGRSRPDGDDEEEQSDSIGSIRERQRRRRDSSRATADIHALLGTVEQAEDEDEQPAAAALPKVWLVFQGSSWSDPSGSLRESDSIVGVFATEEAARRRVSELNTHTAAAAGEGDAWYQPYSVES